MKERNRTFKHFLQSRIVMVVLLLVTVVSLARLSNEIIRRAKIGSEITKLRTEIETLQHQQDDLSGLIERFNSEEYIEEQARKSLKLKKPGESVVVIADDLMGEAPPANSTRNSINAWSDYFFGNNES